MEEWIHKNDQENLEKEKMPTTYEVDYNYCKYPCDIFSWNRGGKKTQTKNPPKHKWNRFERPWTGLLTYGDLAYDKGSCSNGKERWLI